MKYQETGIFPGDTLLGELVDKQNYCEAKSGIVYIVILQSSLVARRLQELSPENKLLFKADNPDYDLLEIPVSEILELWEVRGIFTTHTKIPNTADDRLQQLEKTVQQMQQKLNKLLP